MALSFNGQLYREERRESPAGSFQPRGDSRLSMNVRVPHEDFLSLAAHKAFLGWSRVGVNGTTATWPGAAVGAKYLSYTNPFTHPDWPSQFFVAETFDRFSGHVQEGLTANQTPAFDEEQITLGFKSQPDGYQLLADAAVLNPVGADPARYPGVGLPVEYWCNRNMAFQETAQAKAQSIPPVNSGLVWGSDLTAASLAAYVPLYETRLKIEWWPVPLDGFMDVLFEALVGSTNAYPFPDPVPFGVPPSFLNSRGAGTLVMGPVGKKLIRQGDCSWAWKITLNLSWHPYGANYFYNYRRSAGGVGPGYDLIRRRPPDTSVLFPSLNWNVAFVPV